MPISISTTSTLQGLPGLPAEQTFEGLPIIIGRSQACDLILPDQQKYVSSQHAQLSLTNGQLIITDTSSNGTFLNGAAERIAKGDSVPIASGDILTMGVFKLQVTITEAAPAAPNPVQAAVANSPNADDPFADDPFNEPAAAAPAAPDDPFDFDDAPIVADRSAEEHERRLENMGIGPSAWDDLDDIPAAPGTNSTQDPFGDAAPPPPAAPASPTNDDDWDGWLSEIPTPPPPPAAPAAGAVPPAQVDAATVAKHLRAQPAAAAGTATGADDSIATLLKAAGLNPADFAHIDSHNLASHAGNVLNRSVQSMMLLLHSRDEMKNAMRAEMTLLAPRDNNPLRFSASVEDSLTKLLTPNAANGFTDANTAIDRALRDIKIHQLAMLEATRSALHIVLSHFEPDLLEAHIRKKSPIAANMPLAREAKLWEQFQLRYEEIKREALDDFSDIFGRELRKAYEQSVNKLKQSID